MAQVIWSPEALDDLKAIVDHIANDSPRAAARLSERVVSHVELLGQHPNSGSLVLEDPQHRYREIYKGNYRVIYRYDGATVWIVTVRHGARLLDVTELN